MNRLSREISVLRLAQQQQANGNGNGSGSMSPVDTRFGMQAFLGYRNPMEPTTEMMLEAMRRENEQLRARLVDTERDYIRVTRLNEIYREELIEHRRRVSFLSMRAMPRRAPRMCRASYVHLPPARLARGQPHWPSIHRPLLTTYPSSGIIIYIIAVHIDSHQSQSSAYT